MNDEVTVEVVGGLRDMFDTGEPLRVSFWVVLGDMMLVQVCLVGGCIAGVWELVNVVWNRCVLRVISCAGIA
jgi:hypothetical protein